MDRSIIVNHAESGIELSPIVVRKANREAIQAAVSEIMNDTEAAVWTAAVLVYEKPEGSEGVQPLVFTASGGPPEVAIALNEMARANLVRSLLRATAQTIAAQRLVSWHLASEVEMPFITLPHEDIPAAMQAMTEQIMRRCRQCSISTVMATTINLNCPTGLTPENDEDFAIYTAAHLNGPAPLLATLADLSTAHVIRTIGQEEGIDYREDIEAAKDAVHAVVRGMLVLNSDYNEKMKAAVAAAR